MATINISTEKLKKAGFVALVAISLFSFGVSASYVQWRRNTKQAFQLLDFDLQTRLPQIKAAIIRAQQEANAKAAQAAAQAAEQAATPATPAPAPTPAPTAEKK